MGQMRLSEQRCVPCRGGVPPLTRPEIAPLIAQVPDWKLADDALSISRTWKFKDYMHAQEFFLGIAPKIGEIAEEQGHHPDLAYGWGYVRVTLQTHAIKGLHQNDFILAAKIDALLA